MANFTNQPISESYDRVLQIDGGILQNGFGIPPISVQIESLTVPNGIIGNLQGTATIAETASFTLTASYVENAVSASVALTASYLSGSAETASFAISASYALTASYAESSSYVFDLQEVTSKGGITSASVSILGGTASGSATASFNEGRFDILGDTAEGTAYSASFNSGSGATIIKSSQTSGSVNIATTFEQYNDRYSLSLLDNANSLTASISAYISGSVSSSIDIIADQVNIPGILITTASYIFNLQEVTSRGGITSASVSILGAPLSGSATASFDAGKFEIVGDTANGLVYSASFNSGSNSGETVIKVTQLSGSINTISTFEQYSNKISLSLLDNSSSLSASITADISNPLTSSINITASQVNILGQLNATASNAISSSYAVTSSFLNHTSSLFEVHVCTNTGTDETGSVSRGTLLYPYKTIEYAVSQSSAGYRIIVHRGVYNETVVLTNANTSIVGYEAGNGALTEISGLTVDVASSSTRVSNIKVNTLVHQNTAPLFLNNVHIPTQATLNGGNVEFSDCRVEAASGISKTTAGAVFVQNSTFYPITINHASASVSLKNLISTVQPTVQAGTLSIIDTTVYPALSGSAAIVASAGATVSLINSQVVDAAGTPQRVNIGGTFTYSDSIFDQRNSNLGTLAPVTARFTDIEGRNLTLTGSLLMTGSLVVQGKIQAREIETLIVSSSVLFESGSTRFGNDQEDTHEFTGSIQISGSASGSFSGSFVGDGSGLTGIRTFVSSSLPASASVGTLAFNTTEELLYVELDGSGSWKKTAKGAEVIVSSSLPISASVGTLAFDTTQELLYVELDGSGSWKKTAKGAEVIVSSSLPISASLGTLAFDTTKELLYVDVDGSGSWTKTAKGAEVMVSSSLPISASVGTLAFDTAQDSLFIDLDGSGSWKPTVRNAIITSSAPVSQSKGTLWFNTESDTANGGELFILMNETSSNWVPVMDSYISQAISSSYATTASFAFTASHAPIFVSSSLPVSRSRGTLAFNTADNKLSVVTDNSGSWTLAGGGSSVIVSESAPVSQSQGALWFNISTSGSNGGELYIQANATGSAWVPVIDNTISQAVSASFAATASHAPIFVSSSLPVSRSLGTLAFNTSDTTLYVVTTNSSGSGSWTAAGGGGGAEVIISASAPVSESRGTLWFNTNSTSGSGGELYILMNETSSNWIPVMDNRVDQAVSSSFALTASYLAGSVPTLVHTQKASVQSIPNTTSTRLIDWNGPVILQNAAEWNATTGIFTATKPGTYLVTAVLQMDQRAWNLNTEINLTIRKNSSGFSIARWFSSTGATYYPSSITTTAIVNLSIGETIDVLAFQGVGAAANTLNGGTYLTIQEIPGRLTR